MGYHARHWDIAKDFQMEYNSTWPNPRWDHMKVSFRAVKDTVSRAHRQQSTQSAKDTVSRAYRQLHFRQQAYLQNLLFKDLLQLSTKETKLPINNGQINEIDSSKK